MICGGSSQHLLEICVRFLISILLEMEDNSELQDNVLVGSELLTTSLPNHIYVLETASERSTIEIY